MTETYDDNTVFLRQDSLVNLPAIVKVQQHIRHRLLLQYIFKNTNNIIYTSTAKN